MVIGFLAFQPGQQHGLRNMVVSLNVRRNRAMGEAVSPVTPQTHEAFGQLKPSFEKLNETETLVSDMVHIRDCNSAPSIRCRTARGISPDRLPLRDGADISAATPI